MGPDAALGRVVKDDKTLEAEVVELLPSAAYKLRLLGLSSGDEGVIIAHAAGAAERNFVRLRPGDRVRVVLSERDKTRGRILELLQ